MNRAVRERLEASEVPLISTDVTGAATLVIETHRWQLKTMSGIHLMGRAGAAMSATNPHKSQTSATSSSLPELGLRI